ncbi:hypothetical protein ACEQPO_25705 [Bacillus sp. SL00103]
MEIVVHLGTANSLAIITAVIDSIVILAKTKIHSQNTWCSIRPIGFNVSSCSLFQGQVETIGSAYGEIPRQLPSFAFPEITIEKMIYLLPPAIVIAL